MFYQNPCTRTSTNIPVDSDSITRLTTSPKAVFFTLRSNYTPPKLQFQHCPLEFITSHKHLGLVLSQDLSWSAYIDSIVKKAYQRLGLLKKLKFTMCRKTLSKMYTTFIRPLLEYSSIVWDSVRYIMSKN